MLRLSNHAISNPSLTDHPVTNHLEANQSSTCGFSCVQLAFAAVCALTLVSAVLGQAPTPPLQDLPCGVPTHASPDGGRRSALPFSSEPLVWVGEGQIATAGQAAPANLTYSFPEDGTPWGLRQEEEPYNDIGQHIRLVFGIADLDLGREYIRQALAAWGMATGVRYREVADDGSPMDEVSERIDSRGDIRIGGLDTAVSVRGYNGFPVASGVDEGGGDMVINTSLLVPGGELADPTDAYRFLRFLVAHEHGHGLGFHHVAPCNQGHTMQQIVAPPGLEPIGVDDRRGGASNYGDRLAPNHTQATAARIGPLIAPGPSISRRPWRDVVLRSLALNGAGGPDQTNQDWLTFELPSRRELEITVTPVGGQYQAGDAGEMCALICPVNQAAGGPECLRDADRAGNLAFELHDRSGLLYAVDSTDLGGAESLTVGLDRGDYWLRIHDVGPNPSENLTVQLYDLEIRHGGQPAAPVAAPGIDKRIGVNQRCYFIGDILSHAVEPGTSIVRYDWDLDGDGKLDVKNNPRPVTKYETPGLRTITLRVTDSGNRRGFATIDVDVVE